MIETVRLKENNKNFDCIKFEGIENLQSCIDFIGDRAEVLFSCDDCLVFKTVDYEDKEKHISVLVKGSWIIRDNEKYGGKGLCYARQGEDFWKNFERTNVVHHVYFGDNNNDNNDVVSGCCDKGCYTHFVKNLLDYIVLGLNILAWLMLAISEGAEYSKIFICFVFVFSMGYLYRKVIKKN